MYAAYFGLSEIPFSIAPNPRYMYMSTRHREAMAHLLYGIQQAGGFVVLTGEVGTGKTTLCRCLLSQLPDDVDVALLLNPNLDSKELLAAICDELKIEYQSTSEPKQLLAKLNDFLLTRFAEGRHTVVIIDEAQLLSGEVLEQIRLLTNLETTTRKLLQIILIAQPEFNATLQRTDLRQLTQRITARYHLSPLSSRETSEYIRYRLGVAGCQRSLFSGGAVQHIFKRSAGVPRLVNVICDRALMGAYAKDMTAVTASIARTAAREVLGESGDSSAGRSWVWIPIAASLAVVLLFSPIGDPLRHWAWGVSTTQTRTDVAVATDAVRADASTAGKQSTRAVEPDAAASGPEPAETIVSALPDAPGLIDGTLSDPGPLDGTPSDPAPGTTIGLVRALETPDWGALDDPGVSDLLREYGVLGGRLDAFQRLIELWGRSEKVSAEDRVCEDVERLNLRCYRGRGTWNNLRSHNRAAILVLRSPQGRPHYAVATALSEVEITLDFAHERVRLPITEVDPYWFGEYWFLWKPLPSGREELSLGDEGPDVVWLRRALTRTEYSNADLPALNEGRSLFDSELMRHVIAYQKRNGLAADGIVGVETLLHLNSKLNKDILPLLLGTGTG